MPNVLTEDQIEKAAIALLTGTYGYRTLDCMTAERNDLKDRSGRASKEEVVFTEILREQMRRLNPALPESAIEQAIATLSQRRSLALPLVVNKEVYGLLRGGVPVEYTNDQGRTEPGCVRVIDFENPASNDFLAVTQLWIFGERTPRRPDILIYVNGLPMVFIELKNSNVKVQNAYDDNLTNYRHDIPQLFAHNAFCVLSNGLESRVGSFNASYEYFFPWLRSDDETENVKRADVARDGTSLERVLHGLFPKERLLDYIENFILFHKDTVKVVAQNHQFLGVNKAIESFRDRKEKSGKLGVFWHTQGSGKSFSMIFLTRKIFRKFGGNYTFVVVTDREDLDSQIYRNFLDAEAVSKSTAARPRNSAELRDFLGRNLRVVFTLIQKFRIEKGREYPLLSERDDIIVIVDEAHRSQYATFAENLRKGLPKAQFFAFTGTPILGKGEKLYQGKTFDWFGNYVSQYNFGQSVEDGATVPLFYQKRVSEVLIQNENLSPEFYAILEDENIDEAGQQKLEKQFAVEMEIIKRDARLDTIADDIVAHFPMRGYKGKGMMVTVDKFTAVKMFEKVQLRWKEEIKKLVGQVAKATSESEKLRLRARLEYMRRVEMAVVVSEEAGEEEKFEKQKLDIRPHRKKMNTPDANGHDIEYQFKDPTDPLQLVFVCAMWLTGFDAPTVSTLYLDKPMQGHSLMQTIARANRVSAYAIDGVSKLNGEIVDYYNVFRSMKRALGDYALGDQTESDNPVQDKSHLFALLDEAVVMGERFCRSIEIDLGAALGTDSTFGKLECFKNFADTILAKDASWKEFKVYENAISSLYEAAKPEILRMHQNPLVPVFQYLRAVVESQIGNADVESVKLRIAELLDQSVVTSPDALTAQEGSPLRLQRGKVLDLSTLDFAVLKSDFKETDHKNIEIANLREFLIKKLEEMLRENATRSDFAARLQAIVDRYNAGGQATEDFFDELVRFTQSLKAEDERHIREGLTPEELEIFDTLKKDSMTEAETVKVKNAAKHLVRRLREERPKVLVQDWWKDQQSKQRVQSEISAILDQDLPEDAYDRALFSEKTTRVFQLIVDYAERGYKWAA
jgi:type I restriction enzyme R subunit